MLAREAFLALATSCWCVGRLPKLQMFCRVRTATVASKFEAIREGGYSM